MIAANGVLSAERDTAADRGKSSASPFTAEDVAALVRKHFGVELSEVRLLAGERDQILHLEAGDRRQYLLKIYAPDESADIVNLESRALVHLAACDPGLPVQHVIPGLDGKLEARFRRGDAPPRIAKLLSYLPGALLASNPRSSTLRARLGGLLARIDKGLASFSAAPIERNLVWDLQRAGELAPKLSQIGDFELRRHATKALEDFSAICAPALRALRRQAIHGDLTPFNILVDPSDPDMI